MSPGMSSSSQGHPQLQQSVTQLHRGEDRDRALLLVLPGQFSWHQQGNIQAGGHLFHKDRQQTWVLHTRVSWSGSSQ